MTQQNRTGLTRRRFLSAAGTVGAGAALAACAPAATPAPAPIAAEPTKAPVAAPVVSTGGGTLTFLTWNNFVPEMDAKLDELCKA